MPSSFSAQINTIIHICQKINPKTILDIGKGFGKYGFLLHEYMGIGEDQRIDPNLKLKDQSSISIDCVEVDPDLFLPQLAHFYQKIIEGNILEIYTTLPKYDLILMVDIIEHIPKEPAIKILQHFLTKGSNGLVATPVDFFEQSRNQSEYEHHVSHWTAADFKRLGCVSWHKIDAGAVYLLSSQKLDIRGFGRAAIKRIRRIFRAIRNEF